VKLPEGSEGRPSFGRKPKDGNKFASFGFLRKAATPPEVKLSEGSARGEASRRTFIKPPEVKLPEGSRRTPFLREDALFSKQVHQAEGRAFFKTSWLPSESRHPARGEASRRKPPEVKLLSETSSSSRQR